ncbi:MAG: invasion associated locus B family protein [Gammaproteobacteria bacterium]|nr:invasion associated locus B family protein [Gammaproteobacteria bacterium]
MTIALTSLALAARGDEADEISEQSFEDWVVRCESTRSDLSCYLFQNVFLKDGDRRLAQLAVGYPDDRETAVALVTLPLGVLLTRGIVLSIDGAVSLTVYMQRCTETGCHGRVLLPDNLLQMFKDGRTATVQYERSDGRQLVVPISLSGFTAGLEAVQNRKKSPSVSLSP